MKQREWFEETHQFDARPTENPDDCKECWATQFRCPKCGPCTYAMVMTTKCCARCMARPHGVGTDIGLIRRSLTRCQAHSPETRPKRRERTTPSYYR